MNWLRNARGRFQALFQKERLDREMAEELRSHIDMQAQEKIEAGMKPEEARRAALREFGWMDSIKESCREQRVGRSVEEFLQDLRYGARTLLRNPGFTAVAAFTLALGIGADTAIFSAVNALVLQPLPYKDSARIVQLLRTEQRSGRRNVEVSPADFIDFKGEAHFFETIGGWRPVVDFVDPGAGAVPPSKSSLHSDITIHQRSIGPVAVKGVAVSADLFALLGTQPYLGRAVFLGEEGQAPVTGS